MEKNQLGIPKYFIVKSDSSPEFNEYVGWLNKTYSRHWDASAISFNGWLGYDRVGNHDGTDYYHHPHEFHNNPAQFTAQEFMKLVKSEQIKSEQMKKIIIPEALLAIADKEATLSQKEFIKDHMNIFTREVSEEDVITFYNSITCSEWKFKFEEAFEFLKPRIERNTITFSLNPDSNFRDLHINKQWVGRILVNEEQGSKEKGYYASGHLASVYLSDGKGTWYNEKGDEIKGYLYYRPDSGVLTL